MPSYYEEVLADNPAHYWRMESDNEEEDLIGTYDLVQQGTINSDPPFTDANDNALSFDGSDWCDISGDDGMQFVGSDLNAFTVEFWAKFTGVIDSGWTPPVDRLGYATVFKCGQGFPWVGAGKDGRLSSIFASGAGLVTRETDEVFDDALWHHCVIVYDGGERIHYIDCDRIENWTDVQLGAMPSIDSEARAYIGADKQDVPVNEFWIGQIDEVAIYNHALSEERVCVHYNARNIPPIELLTGTYLGGGQVELEWTE